MAANDRAAAVWARGDLCRRWPSLIILGLLAGVTAGVAMAAFAGARRTDTALERLEESTNATDAIVFSSQVGQFTPDWDALRARPEVATVAVWDLMFGELDGEAGILLFAADDGIWLNEVNRPIVTEGRMFDPAAPDEVVMSEAANIPAEVGDTFSFRPYARGQDDTSGEASTGPLVTITIVGKVRTVNQFLFTTDQVFMSPGFVARYGDEINIFQNADVRLRNPKQDVPALQRDVNDVIGPGTPVLDLGAVTRRIDTTLSVERTALLLLAGAVALAGGLLVAQALVRSAGLIGDDARVLRAIGMTRGELASAVGLSHVPTIAVAAVTSFATALGASQLFPVGLGRKVDPDVGVHADWVVLAPGVVLTAAVLVAATLLIAHRASSLRTGIGPAHPSRVLAAIRRRAPLTVGIGTSIALDGGTGRNKVAVRPALLGAVVGVLGVVGTMTIDHGINDSLAHPERAGVVWDAQISPFPQSYALPVGFDKGLEQKVLAALPSGSKVAEVDRAVLPVNGVGAPAFAVRTVGEDATPPISLALTSGRSPARDDEVAIGPKTAADIGVKIGDTITIGDSGHSARVVGTALFPTDVHAEFDEGIWLTPAQLDSTAPPASDFRQDRRIVVRFAEGTDIDETIAQLSGALGGDVQFVETAELPDELTNLRNIRTLPLVLAGFLALLALAALSHVLATSARRRRRDFAVLRAIGLNRRATRLVLNAQGTAIGVVGLLLGIPLGVALGRIGWRLVADQVPLTNVPPFAVLVVLLIVPATVLLTNALALWPGRRVARLRPAEVLRTE